MNRQEIASAFEDVFDQAIVFHGFAEHMRDYDVFVYATADPRTGIVPEHLRYRFTHCVRATAVSAVRSEVWQRSLDERLLDYESYAAEPDLDGYVWGVNWQALYPEMSLREESAEANDLGIDPTQLRLLSARGRLERVARGAYRVSVLPRGQHDDLAEAVAWSLGRGVVSHESALVLHGISDVNPSRVHLTAPRDNYPRAAGGDLYRLHRRELPAADVTASDGIVVTTVERAIRDCLADGTDPYQLRRAIDRAAAEGLLRKFVAEALRGEIAARGASA